MTRRRFVARAGAAALGLGLEASLSPQSTAKLEHTVFLPLAARTFPRVVRVHSTTAAHWDYSTGWFGDHVDQAAVDAMMAAGLCALTGAANAADAWKQLLPQYQPGQKIAVKVNFNNSRTPCVYTANCIDALIEPVNALISTLAARGVSPEDVYVYDAKRVIPDAFYNRRRFVQSHYLGFVTGCSGELVSYSKTADLLVRFTHPNLAAPRYLTDLLRDATYVINMPIIKKHSANPLTLGFKNHFGSLDNLGGATPDNPHLYIQPTEYYRADTHPVVDIYAHPYVCQKTVLTVGDALFGARSVGASPQPWATFGGHSPASLLFSRDPVAADCVMADLLNAEWPFPDHGYDYLRLANQRGLGLYEKGDPWHAGYRHIDYQVIEL